MNERSATRVAFVVVPAIPAVIGAVGTPVTREFSIVSLVGFAAIFYVITGGVTAAFGAPNGCGVEVLSYIPRISAMITRELPHGYQAR